MLVVGGRVFGDDGFSDAAVVTRRLRSEVQSLSCVHDEINLLWGANGDGGSQGRCSIKLCRFL